MRNKAVAFRASADVKHVRTETFDGREYTVVPVVALVEGTIQSMNSDQPELCLASEFGKFFVGWNGRPLVMNHPVVNGLPVCANQPDILEEYQIGFVFNASVSSKKLNLEAWIDNEKAKNLNTASAEAFKAMQAGETVEVSTGLYTNVLDEEGSYGGEEFFGVWTNIVPDHLAILEAGLTGACSVADGCGTNRVNTMAKAINPEAWRAMTCKTVKNASADEINDASKASEDMGKGKSKKPKMNSDGDCQCKTQTDPTVVPAPAPAPIIEANSEVVDAPSEEVFPYDVILANLRANMIPDGMLTSDAAQLVSVALHESYKASIRNGWGYCYVVGLTNDKVVYGCYDEAGYETYQRSYQIASDGSSVTLGSDVEAVNLVTKIVPRIDDSDMNEDMSRMSKENEMKTVTPIEQKASEAAVAPNATTTTPVPVVNANSVPVVNANSVTGGDPTGAEHVGDTIAEGGATGKAHTIESLLANSSPELRESIEEGQRVLRAKKSDLIGRLKASGRCKITDQRLNGMKVQELEELCELAAVPTYEGRASASDPTEMATRTNNQPASPVPAPIFEIGKGFAA